MSISNRIKEIRKALNLNQEEFGKKIGVKQGTIAGYENDLRMPRESNILSICKEYNVNENWLRSGIGSMFLEKDPDQEFMEAIGSIDFHNNELIKKVIIDYMKLSDENKKRLAEYIIELAEIAKKELEK